MNRRNFLKIVGLVAAVMAIPMELSADETAKDWHGKESSFTST
jgi:hypothetical protein